MGIMTFKLWKAVALMSGTVVGAGVLGLPYVVAKAGFLTGLVAIAFLGFLVVLLALYFGEVVLRTKGNHQMVGYADIYLGKVGKYILSLVFIFSVTGALTAYTIGVGASIHSIVNVGSPLLFSLLFFAFGALCIYFGLTLIENIEFILFCAMLTTILVIIGFSFANADTANIDLGFHPAKLLVPYGVALFAFLGLQAIPEMKIELKSRKKLLKWAIFIGMIIPCILYLLFSAAIVSISGSATTEIATLSLSRHIGLLGHILGNIFAIIAMSTSFLILGLALRDVYMYDYQLPRPVALVLTCAVPLLVAVFKVASFISIIGLVGIFMGGVEGVMVVLMILRAKKHGQRVPEYSMPVNWFVLLVLILLFVGGTISYFAQLVG